MNNRSLKIPQVILPLLKHADDDVKHTLNYYYKKEAELARSTQTMYKSTQTKFKAKFSQDTLKRLFPEKEKSKADQENEAFLNNSTENFTERLVLDYSNKFKDWSNDKMVLYDHWKGYSEEERVRPI